MGKAVQVQRDDVDSELDQEAMILMIPRYLWDVLCIQAGVESTSPGMILDRALQGYLKEKGAPEAVEHLWKVARKNGGV